jgi:hypothetical protein
VAILDTEKIDFLWKRLLFGVSKTAAATDKAGSNEIIPSPITVLPNAIWKAADLIPAQPPVANTAQVRLRTGAGRIAATYDPTSAANLAWLATTTPGNISTRQTDFIPPTFGSNYAVKVYLGDPNVGPAARIFPDTTGEEWVFDYTAGVLLFTGTIPSGKTATIGSGTVSAATNGVYFEAYQYQGERGVGADPAADGFELPLGDDIASDGSSIWDSGAVVLLPTDSVSEAISKLSQKLALAATDADLDQIAADLVTLAQRVTDAELAIDNAEQAIDDLEARDAGDWSLGDDIATDGLSLWDGGLVAFLPTDSIAYAISRLNHKILEIKQSLDNLQFDGFHIPLGDVAVDGDGSWLPGAVPLNNSTPVSEAVDQMNEILAKLLPASPPAFPNATPLTITNTTGSSPLLATGVANNTGGVSPYAPGDPVVRIVAAGINSNSFNDVGPGENGTVVARVNGGSTSSHILTGVGDNGTYTGLVISDQKDYPVATPGFWKSIDITLTGLAAPSGVNKVSINHTAAGATNEVFFVRDGMTATPVISQGRVTEGAPGTLAYSSGVPHYNLNAQLLVDAFLTNFAGETYYGGVDPVTITGTNGILNALPLTYTQLGISTPFARQSLSAVQFSTQFVSINGNVHGSGQVQATAKNVNGPTSATLSSDLILVKRGVAPTSKIDEMSVQVINLGLSPNGNNAVRVTLGAGDTPAGAPTAWVQNTTPATYEATVIAGVLKHDQTNYATGYLPVGPNLSVGRSTSQYITFSFKRTARSTFKIAVSGTYSGCRIKLPGVSDNLGISPNAASGWWDAFKPYDGAGVPGETGDTVAGCGLGTIMAGAGGVFVITFGTQSSSNATGNEILVRFKLEAGQSITTLAFTS